MLSLYFSCSLFVFSLLLGRDHLHLPDLPSSETVNGVSFFCLLFISPFFCRSCYPSRGLFFGFGWGLVTLLLLVGRSSFVDVVGISRTAPMHPVVMFRLASMIAAPQCLLSSMSWAVTRPAEFLFVLNLFACKLISCAILSSFWCCCNFHLDLTPVMVCSFIWWVP